MCPTQLLMSLLMSPELWKRPEVSQTNSDHIKVAERISRLAVTAGAGQERSVCITTGHLYLFQTAMAFESSEANLGFTNGTSLQSCVNRRSFLRLRNARTISTSLQKVVKIRGRELHKRPDCKGLSPCCKIEHETLEQVCLDDSLQIDVAMIGCQPNIAMTPPAI